MQCNRIRPNHALGIRPNRPNHVCAIEFGHDKLSNNRPYEMLTVVDEYTR